MSQLNQSWRSLVRPETVRDAAATLSWPEFDEWIAGVFTLVEQQAQVAGKLTSEEPPSRRGAIDLLAQRLVWELERIDPTDERIWGEMSEREREVWRRAVDYLFRAPREWLDAASGITEGGSDAV